MYIVKLTLVYYQYNIMDNGKHSQCKYKGKELLYIDIGTYE